MPLWRSWRARDIESCLIRVLCVKELGIELRRFLFVNIELEDHDARFSFLYLNLPLHLLGLASRRNFLFSWPDSISDMYIVFSTLG